jgi:2',3'-cyclic-nucleotide 2'-phosphodiesterase (5'-nucleotidase family)
MKQTLRLLAIALLISTSACKTARNAATKDDGKIEVVFVQVNDVYEIAPISGGKEGGMARVATLKKQYQQANPNTFMVMSGDFVSPSIYSGLVYNGKRVRGAQMIETMNAAGMNFVCFGNHEFDITESELQDRINESRFTWISANAFHKTKDGVVPFKRSAIANAGDVPKSYIMKVKDKDGTTAKIGFIGVVLTSNRAEFVSYDEPLAAAKQVYNQIKDSVDAVVAITHQDTTADRRLAEELPGLAAILGGHEHIGYEGKAGNVYITKGKSNARTAYVVKLDIDKKNKSVKVTPEVKEIDASLALDSATNVVVNKWGSIVDKSYAALGFDTKKVIIASGEPLEAREQFTYRSSSNFTKLITDAMASACPQADVVIVNSGSLRLDDILTPPITQYDIIRSLPYGGGIREADMKGSLLIHILEAGRQNLYKGGWLQYSPVVYNASTSVFTINNAPIDANKTYRVALNDFLFTGKEINLDFLNPNNPDIVKVYPAETAIGDPRSDIRLAIVKYLEKNK